MCYCKNCKIFPGYRSPRTRIYNACFTYKLGYNYLSASPPLKFENSAPMTTFTILLLMMCFFVSDVSRSFGYRNDIWLRTCNCNMLFFSSDSLLSPNCTLDRWSSVRRKWGFKWLFSGTYRPIWFQSILLLIVQLDTIWQFSLIFACYWQWSNWKFVFGGMVFFKNVRY